MSGVAMLEMAGVMDEAEARASALAVFDVQGTRGTVRVALLDDGALVRVSPVDPMAVWPVQRVTMLVVEEYAIAPAEMQLRVHTSCGQVLRLRGAMPGDALMSLLRLESSLTLG